VQFEVVFPMSPEFPAAIRDLPVTIHTTVFLSVFGNAREETARLGATPVNVIDGLQCYRDRFGVVYCQSAFRWPRKLVYARLTDAVLSPINSMISYSPFPSGFGLNPLETHWGSGPSPAVSEVSIVVKEPLAYIRRDLVAADVVLEESGPGILTKHH
jgi:hypothetical protein